MRTLSVWKKATSVILHTRYPTQGSKFVPHNNHPIEFRNIVGVHNGSVYNDDDLYRTMALGAERKGMVDSSAIFATLAAGLEPHPSRDGNRIEGATNVIDLLQELEGGIATAWFDRDLPGRLHLARLTSSPLHFVQTQGGSVLFASEKQALERALDKCNLAASYWHECQEGEYIEVQDGKVVGWQSFAPNRNYRRSWSSAYSLAWELGDYSPSPLEVRRNGKAYKYQYSTAAGGYVPVNSAKEAAEAFASTDYGDLTDEEVGANAKAEQNEREWGQWLDASMFDLSDLRIESIDRPLRVGAIERYLENRAQAKDLDEAMEAADALGGCLSEDDWVKLEEFGLRVNVYARIVDMPSTFPMGQYTLLAYMPHEGEYEACLIRRPRHQFKLVELYKQEVVTKLHDQVLERGLEEVRQALQRIDSSTPYALPRGDYEVPSFIEREEVTACP